MLNLRCDRAGMVVLIETSLRTPRSGSHLLANQTGEVSLAIARLMSWTGRFGFPNCNDQVSTWKWQP
jgi:hypothetical protein